MMFRVKVLKEHYDRANVLVKLRLDKCLKAKVVSKFDMKNEIELNKAHVRGALGEVLFSDVFEAKIDLDDLLISKIDFKFNGLDIDVKTNDFDRSDADLILFEKDLVGKSNYYFLIVLNKVDGVEWAYFMGGITKNDFIRKLSERNYGYGKRYFVKAKDLTFRELI